VHIVNIHDIPYNLDASILGFWDWENRILGLDKDSLENDEDMAYIVCLHELGHVFGVQHFVNEKDLNALSGWIVVPNKINATTLVMYPACGDNNKHAKLSDLEIELAKKNLPNLYQLARNDCFCLTSR